LTAKLPAARASLDESCDKLGSAIDNDNLHYPAVNNKTTMALSHNNITFVLSFDFTRSNFLVTLGSARGNTV
jgi:hypothetical protein